MAYYLIDYENVKYHGLNGIGKLDENDNVCIFYSENADTLTFGLHRRLNESRANITYHRLEVGTKNALDFQLSSYLGYLISENANAQHKYYIITKDTGFLVLVNYWKKKNVEIDITMDCSGKNEEEEKDQLLIEVEHLLKCKSDATIVVRYIQNYKTKQGINNALNKHFKDSKKTSEIYNAIRPLIADKKGK